MPTTIDTTVVPAAVARPKAAVRATDIAARGEPFLFLFGGALALGIIMIVGFLLMVLWNGILTFYPRPIEVVTLTDGTRVAGEPSRSEEYRVAPDQLAQLPAEARQRIQANEGFATRTLYRTGNYDLYNEDFRWVPDYAVARTERPPGLFFIERLEWGVFVGAITQVKVGERTIEGAALTLPVLHAEHARAVDRLDRIRAIERGEIGAVNHHLEQERLRLRRVLLDTGPGSPELARAQERFDQASAAAKVEYDRLSAAAQAIKAEDAAVTVTLQEVGGRDKTQRLSEVVRLYPANELGFTEKLGVYLSRWGEFLTAEPREANTEGGVMPAIFGTFAMVLLLVIVVAPFGVVTALYLREYAKQGRLVSIVRISVNNLAGVPSIVYGVFGLGFFAYIVGGSIDQIFFPERLPNPTFGTGGLLWSALTLAILTVPVVIVATEEALAAVPRSMREGSLACGASKWQTIRYIVLPRAMPGIMTGLILAMARGAGEVAPLMLVGVVKLAPELPVDGFFPFVHLERSFMHLGFHIFDVGFQSRNSEAGKPMVFVTTLLLILLIAVMNAAAIVIRNRLKRKFAGSQF